jgi:hypothetical protein
MTRNGIYGGAMAVSILRNNRYEGRFRVDGQPFALIQKTGHGWELVWLYGPHPKYPTKGSAAIRLERLAERASRGVRETTDAE